MKKLLLMFALSLGVIFSANAQERCVFSFFVPAKNQSKKVIPDTMNHLTYSGDHFYGMLVKDSSIILYTEGGELNVSLENQAVAINFHKMIEKLWKECRAMTENDFNEAMMNKAKIH